MAFQQYTWKDRQLQTSSNKGKRTITNVDTSQSQVVKFSKDEGKVYTEGTEFTAANMNNLEARIKAGFDAINDIINPTIILDRFYPIGTIYTSFVNTDPHDLFGGTWENISGGLLMAADDLPDTMITSNHHVDLQLTDNYNDQTIIPKGTMEGSIVIGVGYADMPSHEHSFSDAYSFAPGFVARRCASKYIASSTFKVYGGSGSGITRYTPYTDASGGHEHEFKSGGKELKLDSNNTQLNLTNIPINIEKPALTVYCWVRVQ